MPPDDKNQDDIDHRASTDIRSDEQTVLSEPMPTTFSQQGDESRLERSARILTIASQLLADNTVVKERFVLEALLGFGGMGLVFKARDIRKEEAHDRDPWVAIKLLNEDFKSHPSALISLQRESRKSQALSHPNIVKVFDFDRDDDVVFMTMELLRGQDVNQLIRDHPQGLEVSGALDLTLQMGDALAHAHENDIVHADFSPKNVFLTDDGEVKVLDFGIAQAIAVADAELTADQSTVFDPASLGGLTPGYASFERFHGMVGVPSDDVFALACVAYQLFSGKHPYREKTAVEAAEASSQPEPLAVLSRRQWRALAKALALHREQRYSSVSEFLNDFNPPRKSSAKTGLVIASIALVVGLGAFQVVNLRQDELGRQRQEAMNASMEQLRLEQVKKSEAAELEVEKIHRGYLSLASALIVEGKYSEAQVYLDRVGGFDNSFSGLVAVQESLDSARIEHKEQQLLNEEAREKIKLLAEQAYVDIAAGRLVRPSAQNAYGKYQQLVSLEDGSNQVSSMLLLRLMQALGVVYDNALMQGDLDAATYYLADLERVSPDDPVLPSQRARLEALANQLSVTEKQIAELLIRAAEAPGDDVRYELYTQVLRLQPNHPEALDGRKVSAAKIADRERGEKILRDTDALVQQALLLLEKKPASYPEFERAYQHLEEAVRMSPEHAQARALQAQFPQYCINEIEARILSQEYSKAMQFTQSALVHATNNSRLIQLQKELIELERNRESTVLPVSF